MTVIGTVGHVDHGKTALLKALTGIDADRLPEERRRGMTIDVGYAHLDLDDDGVIDFVDLPGHHDLAGNLLVGVGEIDAAMLVIAADAGPQAQTFEHLDILEAFAISRGVVVVTKLDLVDEATRREVLSTTAQLVDASTLEGALVIGASARTGEGIEELRQALRTLNSGIGTGDDDMPPVRRSARLAVDRAFSAQGRGLVVTGTLRGSGLKIGDSVRIEPEGGSGRIRGIQVHGTHRESVEPGGRVALNLAMRDRGTARRGSVVVRGTAVRASDRLLVTVHLLAARVHSAEREMVLHLGTDHVTASLRWIQLPTTDNGGDGVGTAILSLTRLTPAVAGDRFLLRVPSPAQIYAAGWVLDANPPTMRPRELRERLGPDPAPRDPTALLDLVVRYRRVIDEGELESIADGLGLDISPSGAPEHAMGVGPLVISREARAQLDLAAMAAARRPAGGATLGALRGRVSRLVRRYRGVSEDFADRAATVIIESLLEGGQLTRVGDLVFETREADALVADLEDAGARLVAMLSSARPPKLTDAAETAGYPIAAIPHLVSGGSIVRLAPDLAYESATYRSLVDVALGMARDGHLSAASFRDAVETSRRNAVVLLDTMALAGLVRREGSAHVLGPRASTPEQTNLATSRRGTDQEPEGVEVDNHETS